METIRTITGQILPKNQALLTPNGNSNSAKEPPVPSNCNFAAYGIPPRFHRTPPELAQDARKEVKPLIDTLEKFKGLKTPKKGLLILGDRGTGKTTWAAEVCKAALILSLSAQAEFDKTPSYQFSEITRTSCRVKKPRLYDVQFITFWEFIAGLRKSFKDGTPYIRELALKDILILDDLGKVETNRDWFIEAFQELVDVLYNQTEGEKLLYVTSNLSGLEISEIFGQPCKDRLDALCYEIELKGKSLRT